MAQASSRIDFYLANDSRYDKKQAITGYFFDR